MTRGDVSFPDFDADDARLRALFAGADQPPMGDERFTAAVMGRVDTARRSVSARQMGFAFLGVVGAALAVAANIGPATDAVTNAFAPYAAQLPMLSAGASTALLAMALAAAGWLYAERG